MTNSHATWQKPGERAAQVSPADEQSGETSHGANPAPVTDAMVEAVLSWVCDDVLPAYDIPSEAPRSDPELPDSCRAALTAAIGAGSQAVADDPVSFQWRTIDGWFECSISGSAHQRREYAQSMARSVGLGYRELYNHPADERVVEALRAKVEEIRARVEKTICPTFSSDSGDIGEQGRISREDFDTLVISALGRAS